MDKYKVAKNVVVPIITAIIGVYGGREEGKKEVVKNIKQEVNVNMNTDNYAETIKDLVKENSKLTKQNQELKEQKNNDNQNDALKTVSGDTSNKIEADDDVNSSKQIEPYDGNNYEVYGNKEGESFFVAGKEYTNGFTIEASQDTDEPGYAFINLDGKYSKMQFECGHVDKTGIVDTKLVIEGDDKKIREVNLTSDMGIKKVTKLDVKNIKIIKMKLNNIKKISDPQYGFFNLKFY